jgi:dihydropyrimidinase
MELEGVTTTDDFYHGSVAAVAGGMTSFIDFIIPKKSQSLVEAYDDWLARASQKSVCDFGFHCAITWWSSSVSDDMKALCERKGINSFKMYMAYKDALMLNDGELYETFERCRDIGALAQVHAENGEIIEKNTVKLLAQGINGVEGHQLSRTEDVEAEAVNRACTIANQTRCPLYVVHVMSASAADEVMRARERWGNRFIFGEALASGLGVDGRNYYHKCWQHAAGFVTSPHLRPNEETKGVLMKMLSE